MEWQKLAKKEFPRYAALDASRLAEVWDDCYVVELRPEHGHRFLHIGKYIVDAYAEDIGADGMEAIFNPESYNMQTHYAHVMAKKKPERFEGEFINSRRVEIKFRQMLLPFNDADEDIRYFVGGMRWKAF